MFSVKWPKNQRMPSGESNERTEVSGITAVTSHDASTKST